ncbi:MAG: hypothetical protein ACPL7M_08215 [Bryobacteraceae bacterium]
MLHMLRVLIWTFNTGRKSKFRAMMQDLVRAAAGGPVTTRDFPGLVSKHMVEGMTWFSDEWVYPGGLPQL